MKASLEHQNPLVAGEITRGDGPLEREYSLVSVDDSDLVLWAVKPSEEGIEDGLIVRVWNLTEDCK